MKLMIASDIHGSAFYCKEMLKAFENEHADKILLLGDILYHGPRNDFPAEYDTKAVTALLNGMKDRLLCVKGNCDSEVDQMVLEFPMLAEYAVLPVGEKLLYLTHGHVYNDKNPLPMAEGDILMNGHFHVPCCRQEEGFVYMNPGSVSIPKENSWHGYMTLEKGLLQWKDLTGEVKMEYRIS